MLIKYKFSTDEVPEVEIPDGVDVAITVSRKTEYDLRECNHYHRCSLDAVSCEGHVHSKYDECLIKDDSTERAERVKAAFNHLTKTQQRRFRLYADGRTLEEIAALENVSFQSVSVSIEAARKKFLKNYCPIP